jgi:hypothetical protein
MSWGISKLAHMTNLQTNSSEAKIDAEVQDYFSAGQPRDETLGTYSNP